ncbi:uncharacterized protein TNCV_2163371 [Trichonephila clavipes]|nr:uncharacterized protein TNCV_2163371 [Trichonephila clavipes]
MPKFEGPYRVLEVRNNNLMIWKKGRRYTVYIDQVRVYHPRQSDTVNFGNHGTIYEGKVSSKWSNRSHPGKSKGSRRPSGDERKGRRSNKGTAGLEDLRLKRKVRSNGQWRKMIENGPTYAESDRTSGPNIETGKERHLYYHRG